MKKNICILLVLLCSICLAGCNDGDTFLKGYTEYRSSIENISSKCYYFMDSVDALDDFCKDYYSNNLIKEKYNADYFSSHSIVAFLIDESSGGNQHKILSKGINSDGILTLRVVLTNEGLTCDMAYWVVFYELSKKETSNLSSIKIQRENGSYELVNKNDYQTSLPVDMPSDFSIFIMGSNHFSFDSMSHQLTYGSTNATTLMLSQNDLKAIYHLLRDIQFDLYPHMICVSDDELNGYISMSIYGTGVDSSCWVNGGDDLNVNFWQSHQELGIVINQIINDYIKNTDEFKQLEESGKVSNNTYYEQ